MSLIAGNVTVTSVSAGAPVTGVSTGLAGALFSQRALHNAAGSGLQDKLDAIDAASATAAPIPDPAAVQAFFRANPMVNGPLIAGYAATNTWPSSQPEYPAGSGLCFPPPGAANRLAAYQALAAQCVLDAAAIITYFTTNAVVPAGGLLDSGGHGCTGSTTLT